MRCAKRFELLFATVAAAVCAVAAPAAFAAVDPAATMDAFHAALKRNDAAAAIRMLAPEAELFEQGFVDRQRSEYEGTHIEADAAFAAATDYRVAERKILWLGDNAACVLTQTRTSGVFGGQAISLLGTETAILVRAGDGWIIQHIHWSAHPGDTDPAAAVGAPAPGVK